MKTLAKVLNIASPFLLCIAVPLILYGVIAGVRAEAADGKAIQIGKWIDEGSASYESAKVEKEEYEKKMNDAANRMTKAALSNSGLRMTLCTDFRLKRENGEFVPLADDVQCNPSFR